MSKQPPRWVTVSDSEHDHEREALAWLRGRLPDREPHRVWTDFEFTTSNGHLYKVDALAIAIAGSTSSLASAALKLERAVPEPLVREIMTRRLTDPLSTDEVAPSPINYTERNG